MNEDDPYPSSGPKKVREIFIPNILEDFYSAYEGLSKEERDYWTRYDLLDSNRSLFYSGDNKVVISSLPILRSHLHDVCDLMGWKNVHTLSPLRSTHSLCEDIARPGEFRSRVEKIIQDNPGVGIIPYRTTPAFYRMIRIFRKRGLQFSLPETVDPDLEFVTTYAYSKRGFRHLWALASPEMKKGEVYVPEGFIVGDRKEAMQAAWWFQRQGRSFVVKYNRGSQGIGVLLQ